LYAMPKVKPPAPACRRGPVVTNAALETSDATEANDLGRFAAATAEGGLIDLEADEEADEEGCENVVPAVVKMKLNTFCDNAAIRRKLNSIVLDANRLLGEAYEFANFHVLRLLSARAPLPKVDKNFYYRCLLATSLNRCRESTLGDDYRASITAFDALRPAGQAKVDIGDYNQLMADLAIIMSTMATNHLWMNIEGRTKRYLGWRHPGVKPKMRARVIEAVMRKPTTDLDKLFKAPRKATPLQVTSLAAAKAVAASLRPLLLMPSKKRAQNRAHITLPLYAHILRETEAAKAEHAKAKTRFRGRLFTLLPTKAGFTISHIPVSSMMMVGILKKMGLERFDGDGRDADRDAIWRRHFNVNLVETVTRRFGMRIVTDGCAVSVLLRKPTCLVCPDAGCGVSDARLLLKEGADYLRCVGIDPGVTDVVTIAARGTTDVQHISSAQYYEDAKFNMSRRRTDRWNAETEDEIHLIPTGETASLPALQAHITAYLTRLPALIAHRAQRGYRGMRFLRFVSKKKAINSMCGVIAPPDKVTIVGFGNWRGPNGTPIRRRCAGPLQEIKLQLSGMPNVIMLTIDEFRTSKTCHGCRRELTKMKAVETKVKWFNGEKVVTSATSRIHKVLHCRSSQSDPITRGRCGATWDRDTNAAKNILMLTECEVMGDPRPDAFSRKK